MSWFLVRPLVYFHTLCVRTAKALALAWAFTGHLCDKYHNFMSWLIWTFNGCEVQIENSVTPVTVRHHEACQGSASWGLLRFGITRLAEVWHHEACWGSASLGLPRFGIRRLAEVRHHKACWGSASRGLPSFGITRLAEVRHQSRIATQSPFQNSLTFHWLSTIFQTVLTPTIDIFIHPQFKTLVQICMLCWIYKRMSQTMIIMKVMFLTTNCLHFIEIILFRSL